MQNHDSGQVRAGLCCGDIMGTDRPQSAAIHYPDLAMFYSVLKFIHVIAVILWVGGMLFAHCFLRPAAAKLDPPVRLKLMASVLGPFLNAVLVAIVLILLTGMSMIGQAGSMATQSGGTFFMPRSWTLMAGGGIVMMVIFGHIRFALYKRLAAAVAASDWPNGGQAMAGIRRWVGVNLILGIAIVAIAFLA